MSCIHGSSSTISGSIRFLLQLPPQVKISKQDIERLAVIAMLRDFMETGDNEYDNPGN
jgi:hypothetical protein